MKASASTVIPVLAGAVFCMVVFFFIRLIQNIEGEQIKKVSNYNPPSSLESPLLSDSFSFWNAAARLDESSEPERELPSSSTEQPLFVKKTQYSNQVRFLFVAGLGGTGHHGWKSVLYNGQVCQWARETEKNLRRFWYGANAQADHYADKVKADFQRIAVAAQMTNNNATLYCLHLMGKGSMLSYPDFNNPTHHPNMWSLARLAEEAGVDLRLVIIHRHPANQLVSLSLHRKFMNLADESHQMANNGAFLNAQLQLIDPNFYMCVGFDAVNEERVALGTHVMGGMGQAPPSTNATATSHNNHTNPKLTQALAELYNIKHPDDPAAAMREMEAALPDGMGFNRKIQEMEMNYNLLRHDICTRARTRTSPSSSL